ncbi:hypothetical protein ACNKHS_10745 [Shigella flexneri]
MYYIHNFYFVFIPTTYSLHIIIAISIASFGLDFQLTRNNYNLFIRRRERFSMGHFSSPESSLSNKKITAKDIIKMKRKVLALDDPRR